MIHVSTNSPPPAHVAIIERTARGEPGHQATEPWALKHDSGRVDRFATLGEARGEARKSYGAVAFTREVRL